MRARIKRFTSRARVPMVFLGGVLAAFVALLLYNTLFPGPRPLAPRDVAEISAIVMASATPPPPRGMLVHQSIMPSFVLIQTKSSGIGETPDDERGLGSGVIVSDQGDILTSLHVVDGAAEIQLIFADGTESLAEIVNVQYENDIAVLRPLSPPAQMIPATLGNPAALRPGEEVYAVGNPVGLYGSISAGVVSGIKRTFQPTERDIELQDLIQFDAAVNPGNSGGPLINRNGQVVGIVTGLVNPSGENAFSGIGFAVPINVAGGAAGLPPY